MDRPKYWNISTSPWDLARLKNMGISSGEGKGREMILCGSENMISGERDRIARWIVDIFFFVVSCDKAPSTTCRGEENTVVRDREQYEKNEFMLSSLIALMKLRRFK